jgi:4'-phosphopantetheinyl transferase
MISCVADLRALESISVGPCEVVYAFLSLAGEPSDLDEALLDDAERARATRFVRPPDRQRFVLAHAALRLFLARCLDIQPTAVRYANGVHGKPHLGPGLPPLEFNLSHSGGLGVVAVTQDRSVGVDVEQLRDVPDALSIADTHFSSAERAVLRSLPRVEQRGAFFRCWTRKEAVIKATGEGLSRALDSFDVDLTPGATSALKRFDCRPGEESGLSLRDLPASPGHAAAGAVAATGAAPAQWRELRTQVRGD